MNKPTYSTYKIDVSGDVAKGIPPLQPVLVVAGGRPVSSILVRTISPVGQVINLHFGPQSDRMPVYQGEVFGDDHIGPQFDAGVWYSYAGAPAAGTFVELTVFYAPDQG